MGTRGLERVEHRSGGVSGSFKGGIGESVTNVKKSEKMSCIYIHTDTPVPRTNIFPSHAQSVIVLCHIHIILYGPAEMSITSNPA